MISVGIENSNSQLNDIPCAYEDAKKIYNTFEKVLGNNLKKCASVCVKNITTIEFKALISALNLSMVKEDIFIFFFSGHGVQDANGKLQLVFSDYSDEDKKGAIYLEEIVLNLKKYNCQIFIILDCCHSGAGITESINNDYKLESSISIMTSTSAAGQDKINIGGSTFTNNICMALSHIMDNEQQISIHNIFNYIKKNDPNVKLVIGGGRQNVVLTKNVREQFPKDFCQAFIHKIKHENYEMREALWYSVGYLPIEIKIDVLKEYLEENRNSCNELSWRVRRAIGSIYEFGNNKKINEYINQLIHSEKWTDKCVGYICARKSKNKNITDLMCNDLMNLREEYPMDLVWLLMLYLSDNLSDIEKKEVSEKVFNSNLVYSAWGATEIWKTYFNSYDTNKNLEVFKSKLNVEVYEQLRIELYFRGILSGDVELPDRIKDYDLFVKELYQCKTRGKISASKKNKWIFSILYGSWRDQIDITSVFEKKWKSERNKKKLLKALGYIPSVEIKMAILDYLSRIVKEEKEQLDVDSLKWALQDSHPWVIRSALPLFLENHQMVQDNINRNTNMMIYPGVFDLAIELVRQGFSEVDYPINKINGFEKEMLQIAINREQNI